MFHAKHIVSIGAALLFAGTAFAQAKGSVPPEFPFEKVWNGGPQSFDDLDCKVVILDFAQTW